MRSQLYLRGKIPLLHPRKEAGPRGRAGEHTPHQHTSFRLSFVSVLGGVSFTGWGSRRQVIGSESQSNRMDPGPSGVSILTSTKAPHCLLEQRVLITGGRVLREAPDSDVQ